MAYSWSKIDSKHTNIIPFYWLREEGFQDLERLVEDAKAATEEHPVGHRSLFSWDIHRAMSYQINGDFLYTKNGDVAGCNGEDGFIPYRSLWWDNGVEVVRQRFEKFFKAYADIGGKLDVFVLDFEQGFSYWHLKDLADNNYSCGIDAYLDAIQNDSRFTDWREELGFDDLKTLNKWYENDDDLKWSALVWKHLARYIDEAIYQPLKKYFPDADFSNYGYYYQKPAMNLPSIHGTYRHKFTEGTHVGTHQSREIYGWVDLPSQVKLAGKLYPSTPYNAFRFALNKLRAMSLSSEIPVSPWVAYKGFSNSHIYNNDYYQELILHTLLTGVDYLLYWNPFEIKDYSIDDDRLLNQLIQQVNDLIGQQMVSIETTELAHWLDDILLTKIKLEGGSRLWRLTANLDVDQNISDTIISSKPAKLKIKGSEFIFNDMMILEVDNDISDKGLWLISNSPK